MRIIRSFSFNRDSQIVGRIMLTNCLTTIKCLEAVSCASFMVFTMFSILDYFFGGTIIAAFEHPYPLTKQSLNIVVGFMTVCYAAWLWFEHRALKNLLRVFLTYSAAMLWIWATISDVVESQLISLIDIASLILGFGNLYAFIISTLILIHDIKARQLWKR